MKSVRRTDEYGQYENKTVNISYRTAKNQIFKLTIIFGIINNTMIPTLKKCYA
jgi:hypothetical protein